MAFTKKPCPAFHCIIGFTILLLSVGMMMRGAEADECDEGLVTVPVVCNRSEADQACWIACLQRHGPNATAWCRESIPGTPDRTCMCTYTC